LTPFEHLRTFVNNSFDLNFEKLAVPYVASSASVIAQPETFYSIDIDGANFGLLYVGSDVYTIAWDGNIDFSELERIVFQKLPRILGLESLHTSLNGQKPRDTVIASLTFLGDECETQTFNLSKLEERKKYQKLMVDHEALSFVRFDVTTGTAFPFSVTAENSPNHVRRCEAALRLPRFVSCTEALFNWILEHHALSQELNRRVNKSSSLESLRQLTRLNS